MKSKILVTGANGYIGRFVTDYLLNNTDNEIYTVDISPNATNSHKHFQVDFLSNATDANLYEFFNSPDIIIHMAWRDGFKHNSDEHLKNLNNHYCFLKNMVDSGCKDITVMGTMHEIGYWEGEINADTPCNPLSLYGVAKNALRQAMFNYIENKNISLKWLRAYYITGDDKNNKSIFAKLLQAAEEGKKTFPFTDGLNKYDFIDVKELAKQIAISSVQDEIDGIINVCTGQPISLKDKVESFIIEKALDIKLEYGVFPTRKYDSPCVYGNADLINKILRKCNV